MKSINSTLTNVVNSDHTSIVQYGNPELQKQDANFSSFDPAITLDNLNNAGLGSSLQAQVLSGGGMCKSYSVQNIIDPTKGQYVIQNIYQAIVVEVQNCYYLPVTTTVCA
jgi:hypothetical protein